MREEGNWGRRGPEGWRPGGEEEFGWRPRARRVHVKRHAFPGPSVPGPQMAWGGPGPSFGDPRMMRKMRGPRARRGDVRAAALALLGEEPMNGYQIIQAIGERSDGVWRPSPGSVYPALQQLEDEGLVRAEAGDGGRRAYRLTEEGRAYVDAHPEEMQAPWDIFAGSVPNTAREMKRLIGQLASAAFQVVSAGTESQASQARQVLTDARKSLYRILAADDDDTSAASEPAD
jgi:DNA-binding PadR family transcriptional regulator